MSPISQRFPIPTDPDEFEKMGRELLRRYWSRTGMEIFGKRGERQFGIDILDLGGETPIFAAQCKLKEEHKSLTPAAIQREVEEAKLFTPPLGKYGILTTAKVSVKAQRWVREVNQAHRAARLFEVELLTWERLCSLLQQYSDVQEQFYGEIALGRASSIERQLVTIKDGVQSLTSSSGGDEIDSEINDARDCITKREFQLATLLLNRIHRSKERTLTPRQKFRILSNHGAAALGLGKPEAAARYFLEARSCQPEDEQARINEVLAYFLVDDLSTSHAQAELLRSEYPGSSRLAALWLMTAPKELPLSALELKISSVLKSDPEVCIALARKALAEFLFDKASDYAASACRTSPKWSQPYLTLAVIGLGRALHIQLGYQVTSGPRVDSLVEAEEKCSKAIELAREEKDEQGEKAAFVHRVDIRLLLKKTTEATADAETAERLDRQDPQVMIAVAQVRFASGRIDDGISVLTRAYRLDPRADVAFMYGKALSNRGQPGDLDDAVKALVAICLMDVPRQLRPATVAQTVQCLAKKQDWERAQEYIASVSEHSDPMVIKMMQGYLAHSRGQHQVAESHALEALSLLTANVNADMVEMLGRLLMLVGRPVDALPLWERLFDLEAPAFDPGYLLDCAAKLHKHDVVMDVCDRLHKRGINDWHLLEFEISYLEKYKINLAIERLRAFIAEHPDNKLAKLRLSMIGLRLNRNELIQSDPQDLPSVGELPADLAVPAVQVIKLSGNPNLAVDFAYRFLRENFNELEAHHALLVSMMPGLFAADIPPTLEVVGPGAAVCYQEIQQGSPTWVVLEDTEKPNGDFEEVPLNSPVATALSGKKVGETVVIVRGVMQNRSATILQILPKYVRRYQDSMGEMQVRFGAASTVESVQIARPEEGGIQKSLEIILASVERRAAAAAGARDIYNGQPVPLHWYGSRFGANAYTALADLANADGQQIKCCSGTPEERGQAVQALQTAKALVVDLTALATLRLLGFEQILSSKRFRFIVSERTWVALKDMQFKAKMLSGPSGTLLYEDGKHVMHEETEAEKEERFREDGRFITFVEENTEVKRGAGLAAVEPEKREALEKFFGSYGAESMVLASDPDFVLWTDDIVQAQTAAQEFGCRRVWTQLVLAAMADAGLLAVAEYADASAKLVGAEFKATQFDSLSMLAAFRLTTWLPEKTPAAQILQIFSNPTADFQGLMRLFVEFVIRISREPVAADTRCFVIRAFLDAIGNRAEAAGMVFLNSLRAASPRLFGINLIGKDQFERCFDRWLEHRNRPIIYPP